MSAIMPYRRGFASGKKTRFCGRKRAKAIEKRWSAPRIAGFEGGGAPARA
jgi:hypothetical protein